MEELVKWYWEHGVKRGYDVNDPDRELRKISIGGWLDPIVRILDRDKAIQSNINTKACLALWGPSQAGKSTMMSRYIDGYMDDGSDSALTWTDNQKTRFSPPIEGARYLQEVAPGTLVFNPYNHQSDASGVATRYTLLRASDDVVNPDFPIEIKLTTRAQIIQSLSLGYLSECEVIGERFVYTQESFMDELSEGMSAEISPDAYWLLKDIANVIEFMKGDIRFNNLFKRGEWNNRVRKILVSSPNLLSDVNAAKKFMAKIFWDSSDKLTKFYEEADRLQRELKSEWNGCKVLATMEVGSLLLDIDSFKSYISPAGEEGEKIKEKVSKLAYKKQGNEIHVFLKTGGSKISGDSFGYFQAICAELKVPLKKEKLEFVPLKNDFVKLAEKCDFLDFPGVSNKNAGNNIDEKNAALIDLSKATKADIFTKVFKRGKTQCFVYNYAKKYGIDAFSVFVRTDRNPSQSSLLNDGIREWLCSFDSNWIPGRHAEMPVFVNMTFFASLINNVALGGLGTTGLKPYVDRIQELTFARKESAHFFATTYHQFHDGRIDDPRQQDTTIASIKNDSVFMQSTGLTEENIRAVYSSDGGLDYMFSHMTRLIDFSKRVDHCRLILEKDKNELCRLIASQLPYDDCTMSDDRKNKLRDCLHTIENVLSRIEEEEDTSEYRRFAECIKDIFYVPYTVFDAVPMNAAGMSRKAIKTYIKEQTVKWYSHKIADLGNSDYLSAEQKQTIFIALRDSIDEDELLVFIKNNLGLLKNSVEAAAARYSFALAFGNLLQKGSLCISCDAEAGDREPAILDNFINASINCDSSKEGSPYYHMILSPFMKRLDMLTENCKTGVRPPQEGDAELRTILSKFEATRIF